MLTDAKLRAGAASRNLSNLQQRNSVNCTGSTLQEDLMKLIDPDYMMSSDDNFHQGALYHNRPQKNSPNSHSLGNISNISGSSLKTVTPIITDDLLLMRKKSRSREAINLGSHGLPISSDIKLKSDDSTTTPTKSDVIFTTARPAHVISMSASSSAVVTSSASDHQNVLHIKEDRMSQRKPGLVNQAAVSSKRSKTNVENFMQHPLPLLPDSKEVDWTRLVDHAIMQVNEGLKNSETNKQLPTTTYYDEQNVDADGSTSPLSTASSTDASSSASSSLTNQQIAASRSLPELQSQVTQLEDRITKETRRRKSLEQAVRRLTEENRRLQDESQAAVQQLRRFTEWFFQTIDRQTSVDHQ